MKRVGYRTGLIGKKSDYISQFTGGSRSTGYYEEDDFPYGEEDED